MRPEGIVHRAFNRDPRTWLSLLPLGQFGGHIEVILTNSQLTAPGGDGSGMVVVKTIPMRQAE